MVTPRSRRRAPTALADQPQREIIEHARAGDHDAWEILYRRAYPSLLAYARRRLDAAQAEDAVSETMARAITSVARFRWEGIDFSGWLFGIHRHVVADAQRVRRPLPVSRERADDESGALELLVRDDERTLVRRAFARLSPTDQEVLELRVIAGLSVDQVAAALGRQPGAIRTAQCRALERLRRLLQESVA